MVRTMPDPRSGECVLSFNNLRLIFREAAGTSEIRVRDALCELREGGRPTTEDAARLFKPGPVARLSKFAPCLPEPLQQALGARDAFDVDGARAALAEPCATALDDRPRT
jgi:ATP-dependent helicase Lhr and Lhr-like helicase